MQRFLDLVIIESPKKKDHFRTHVVVNMGKAVAPQEVME